MSGLPLNILKRSADFTLHSCPKHQSIRNQNVPGLRRSNFWHKSLHSEHKPWLSGGNCNSVDFIIFCSSCRVQDYNSKLSKNAKRVIPNWKTTVQIIAPKSVKNALFFAHKKKKNKTQLLQFKYLDLIVSSKRCFPCNKLI